MSRLQDTPAPAEYVMGEVRLRPTETRSARGKLVPLDDADAPTLKHGDPLIAQFGYGLGPVVVERVKTGIAGDPGHQYEVPVVEGRIITGQVLGFDPHELYRVREVWR
jgi:hypothetical protein